MAIYSLVYCQLAKLQTYRRSLLTSINTLIKLKDVYEKWLLKDGTKHLPCRYLKKVVNKYSILSILLLTKLSGNTTCWQKTSNAKISYWIWSGDSLDPQKFVLPGSILIWLSFICLSHPECCLPRGFHKEFLYAFCAHSPAFDPHVQHHYTLI